MPGRLAGHWMRNVLGAMGVYRWSYSRFCHQFHVPDNRLAESRIAELVRPDPFVHHP